jgi:RimJ/RimL family protein N-acetyltransferase
MGLPYVILVMADNQRAGAENLHEVGAAMNLGWHSETPASRIAGALMTLCLNPAKRQQLSQKGQQLVDGQGIRRVLDVMAGFDDARSDEIRFVMRPAGPDDAHQLWRLANDPSARENSFSSKEIPWESHIAWYQRKLASPNCCFLVMELGGAIVGQVRYDRVEDTDTAEISFSVTPVFRGKGLGTEMLTSTYQQACKRLGTSRARGVVFKGNIASARAFARAGFTEAGEIVLQNRPCYAFEIQYSRAESDERNG